MPRPLLHTSILVNMMKDALVHASAALPLLLTTTTTPHHNHHPAAASPSSLARVELHLRISIADPGWNLVSEDDVERLFRPLTVIHTPHGTLCVLPVPAALVRLCLLPTDARSRLPPSPPPQAPASGCASRAPSPPPWAGR